MLARELNSLYLTRAKERSIMTYYVANTVIVMIITTIVSTVDSGCRSSTIPKLNMCHDNEISFNKTVMIDTSATAGTDNQPGEQCVCTAEIRHANYVKFGAMGESGICGSHINFALNSTEEHFQTNSNCRRLFGGTAITKLDIMHIGIEKTIAPYKADYCIFLKLELCAPTQYQCRSGVCISKSALCDSINDCPDADDEECVEKEPCTSDEFICGNGECIPKIAVCDGKFDCPDRSDELCSTQDSDHTPIIHLKCFESSRFTTTTSSTTSTTTTTTTTPRPTNTSSTASTTTTTTTTTPRPTTTFSTASTTTATTTTTPRPKTTSSTASFISTTPTTSTTTTRTTQTTTSGTTTPIRSSTTSATSTTTPIRTSHNITSSTELISSTTTTASKGSLTTVKKLTRSTTASTSPGNNVSSKEFELTSTEDSTYAAIIASAIGSVLVVSTAAGAIYLFKRRRTNASQNLNTNSDEIENQDDT